MQPEMRIRVKMVMIDSSEKNGISKEGACGETRRRTIQGTIGEEEEREREEGGGGIMVGRKNSEGQQADLSHWTSKANREQRKRNNHNQLDT